MDVLKYFELFRIQMSQEPTPPDFESMADDAHGILCTDLTRPISPCEVIRIDDVPAHRFHDERRGSIREYEIFRGRVERTFFPRHGQFLSTLAEQGHGNGLEQSLLVLFEKSRVLRLNLPLNSLTLRLGKGKIRDRGISLINGPGTRCGWLRN